MTRNNNGYTLVEVMVATVLAAILILGFSAMLAMLDQQFYRLNLKQKAVFLLQGEMERLITLYQKEYLYYRSATFADNGQLFGRWLYRAHPQGVKCPITDENCFMVTSSFDSSVTKNGWPLGKFLFLNYDATNNTASETNLLWLDRSRNVTAKFQWTLGDTQGTTGNSCCQTLETTLEFPYRFVEGVSPYQATMGSLETITEKTLVCGKIPFPAPVAKTGATVSKNIGDDGDLKRGMPWPATRFSTPVNGTVKDNLTGLMWTENSNCWGTLEWGDGSLLASKLLSLNTQQGGCASYTGNYIDWHISNARELVSLLDAGSDWRTPTPADHLPALHPFKNLTSADAILRLADGKFQSSTTVSDYFVRMHFMDVLKQAATESIWGYMAPPLAQDESSQGAGTGVAYHHWPVRIDSPVDACAYSAPVAKTGNTKQPSPPQSVNDGYVKAGVPLPSTRFRDNGDGTVTDNLTGLMWTKDANLGNDCTGPDQGSDPDGYDCYSGSTWNAGMETRTDAYGSIAICNSTAVAGYRDWRLPNYKELESMLDYGINPISYNHPFQLPNNFSLTTGDTSPYTCYPYITSNVAPEENVTLTKDGSGKVIGATFSTNYGRLVDYAVVFGIRYRLVKRFDGYIWAVRGGP